MYNYSQCGEDGILRFIFSPEGPLYNPSSEKQFIVEVGSWDGIHLSNSYHLLSGEADEAVRCGNNWVGILIEGDETRSKESSEVTHSSRSDSVVSIHAMVGIDPGTSLFDILHSKCPHLPHDFDILSVDIDGLGW